MMNKKPRKPWSRALDRKYRVRWTDEEALAIVAKTPVISALNRPLTRKLTDMQRRGLVRLVRTFGEGMSIQWEVVKRDESTVVAVTTVEEGERDA